MSNNSQLPENSPNRNSNDLSKDYDLFGGNNLWNPDENLNPQPTQPVYQSLDNQKNYAAMETSEPSEYEEYPSPPEPPTEDSPSYISSLTIIEKCSILAIAAFLIISMVFSITIFFKEIPVDSDISKKVELPVKGKILSVSVADTYWREPITFGENADIVKIGIKLIPVIKIHVTGNSGALRIFFRDSDGKLVGDSVTTSISGSETHYISATDGFTDNGMHAAYRTGQDSRWMIQAFEGPSINAPITDFKKLFETEISTEIR